MPEEQEYVATAEDVAEFEAFFGSLRDPEGRPVPKLMVKKILDLLNGSIIRDGWCTRCGGRVDARYPDRKGAATLLDLVLKHKVAKPDAQQPTMRIDHANILVMGPEERAAYKRQLLQQAQRELPSGK